MRWTGWIAIAAVGLALMGCGYGYQMIAVQARYSSDSRPEGSYFCYDCHGYRYFDPYYDYCSGRGFRYRWAEHPAAIAIYRDRYVRIREAHPDYGRYRYRSGYRAEPAYRDPREYDAWRDATRDGSEPAVKPDRRKVREQDGQMPGNTKERKGDKRKGPRDHRSRLTLPGGMS